MPMGRFQCIFASNEPFHGFHLGYDDERGLHARMWEARLDMNGDAIHGDLSTPSGIPVLFGHNAHKQAIGRVVSMGFGQGKMRGVMELSEDDLMRFLAGGFASLLAGINTGLSPGFVFLDGLPTMELREGTEEAPDIRRYPKMEAREVSLTSIPKLKQAGIVRRLDAPTPAEDEGSNDGE